MGAARGPQHLSEALAELIALRGFARVRADQQLDDVWRQVSGPAIAGDTKVLGIKRGVLEVGVSNASLLGELAGFHKSSLLQALRRRHAELNVQDLRFRLKGDLRPS
jgi:hypothetical protein